ncbi:hypothetical protein BU24DRAFT_17791 [Aaosphaeria arxii CBS 175.79]|uniref:Uncharacterized protein n=1 Tax=Aaosphaeria arxii CBS 175.79 TaxID=1450172 RepID=A0A6A5Y8V1_9PLEO|nr:uncharacterized protein BU24DRAFT_17791 [Aaosphaeria arxii CBS 175.79]KAF2021250.1 hypothetical protein BU24DRAFT_17791 [Aaosphaeria arxii CBS 175.79]
MSNFFDRKANFRDEGAASHEAKQTGQGHGSRASDRTSHIYEAPYTSHRKRSYSPPSPMTGQKRSVSVESNTALNHKKRPRISEDERRLCGDYALPSDAVPVPSPESWGNSSPFSRAKATKAQVQPSSLLIP